MKIYGPYIRKKDGRKHVIVYHEGKRTTISWPKYLMQIHLGRQLLEDETVDHIDGDHTNNCIDNLQVLSRVSNSAKQFVDNPQLRAELVEIECFYCGKKFSRTASRQREQVKNKNPGHFCSRTCQGKVYH